MKRLIPLVLVAVITPMTVGSAHAAEADPPWLASVDELDGALSPEVIEQRARWVRWRATLARLHDWNGPYDVTPRPRAVAADVSADAPVYASDVERWRPLVASFFLSEDVPWAMRVLNCESHGDPLAKNPRSTASGLFQHLASYWPERSIRAGWPDADVFDPVANVAVAAWLYYTDGSGHWVCR